jgi:hypothetical protein
MSLSLDHVFICPEDAPAAERALAQFGLRVGRRNELQSEAVQPIALWERVRWRETGASPFGAP